MHAVVFTRPNEYMLTDVPCPEVRTGHVLLTVRSTTICGTDVKILKGDVPFVRFPHIPGHEFSGEIAAVGNGVSGLKPGDRVGVEVHVGCGYCVRCAEGLYNLCLNYGAGEKGHAHIGFTLPGGLADYCLVPARAVHKLPPDLDCDHGAFTDTLGIVLWAFERAGGIKPGETAVVIGPGALGLLAVQAARAFGAGEVIAVGTGKDVRRLEIAEKFGANHRVNLDEDGGRLKTHPGDLVLEFAGTPEAGKLAVEAARRGGRVVLAGATSPGSRLDVDLSTIVRGHLSVFGSVANPRGISSRANTLMAEGVIDVKPLITHHFHLSEFAKAWDIFTQRTEEAFRIMLHPGGQPC